MDIAQSYKEFIQELAQVCQECGRDANDVTVVAVSKTVGAPEIEQAANGGATNFGENRPERLEEMHDLFPEYSWHFIGNIQSRRLKDVVGRATLIHSLFQESHARKISELACAQGIEQRVLLEVNVSGEESKSGLTPQDTKALLDVCLELPGIVPCGLMTMAPLGDEQEARRDFAGLRELLNQLQSGLSQVDAAQFSELSMGMTNDWRIAVREGATIVRPGRCIFSPNFR